MTSGCVPSGDQHTSLWFAGIHVLFVLSGGILFLIMCLVANREFREVKSRYCPSSFAMGLCILSSLLHSPQSIFSSLSTYQSPIICYWAILKPWFTVF
ncbi:hypothetical protein FA15DRAFT_247298 [Coprinopsis marcescibilis]|uniref:Uncharacterized protein n=1 Tax=Coprinopsis marcescibilis TaxID=230819 RepID=A0A5C3L375_COPMA|nr:hypothetical protein FA15DRAFT_247298 [Coprinopsis marcescibilis]